MFAVALVVLGACGGAADEDNDATAEAIAPAEDPQTSSDPSEMATPRTEADDAPDRVAALDVHARLLDGGSMDLGALSGQPVALWMWAPW